MHILHAAFPQALDIVVGNVHAAGKTDVVADQHLAVIAQIDAQIGGKSLGGRKSAVLMPRAASFFQGLRQE